MLFQVRNHELIDGREKTYLTAAVAVAATTITVRAVDSNAWADNDWIIIGEIGTENAEILQINGVVSDGTSLTIDNAGSGGARYVHAVNEPVYRIDFNRIEFSHSATDSSGASSVQATNEVQVDDLFTRFEDTSNTTGFGFVRFNNSLSGTFSPFSDGIPYEGYTKTSLGRIMRMVRRHLGEPDFKFVTDQDITEEVNEKQRDVAHLDGRLWPFYEIIRSASRVANQREYAVDDDVIIGKAHTVIVESEPLAKIDIDRDNILHWDTARTGEPTHVGLWDNRIRLYPTPPEAATTDALNGSINATDVTLTLDSTSGFSPAGRIIVESEVMSYTGTTATTLLGVRRGLEETTAATHADDIVVTERDIIYTAHREPNELIDIQDETSIPGPQVLAYGAAMELALGKLEDQGMHDRLKLKYDESLTKLKDKFGKKLTSQHYRIKDRSEVVTDRGRFRDPNDPPSTTIVAA